MSESRWKYVVQAIAPDGIVASTAQIDETDIGAIGAALNAVSHRNDCYRIAHDKLFDILLLANESR